MVNEEQLTVKRKIIFNALKTGGKVSFIVDNARCIPVKGEDIPKSVLADITSITIEYPHEK